MPKKLLTSLAVFDNEASCIAFTFSGSGDTPFAENTKPKKVRDSLLSSHFRVSGSSQLLQISEAQCVVLCHELSDLFRI